MAIVEMSKRGQWRSGYEYTETISTGQIGNTIKITPITTKTGISCSLIAGTGYGKIQTTISPDAQVAAGNANWVDWPKGSVTGTEGDIIIGQVSGIRGISISGEIVLEVLS